MNKDLKQIVFKGECFDNNDPERLGRIRAYDKSEHKREKESGNLKNGNNTIIPWSDNDPFMYKPLLPWFINIVPKGRIIDGNEVLNIGEAVHLLYSNLERKETTNDRYYIGGIFSSPLSVNREPYESAVAFSEEGINNNKRVNPIITDISGNTVDEVTGIYPDVDDIHIGGRGSSDIIIKDGDLILRSGFMDIPKTKKLPKKIDSRGFLQLSKFEYNKITKNGDNISVLKKRDKPIKKILEYNVSNPENTVDRFSGTIEIFHLDIPEIGTANMSIDTYIEPGKKQLQTQIYFNCLSFDKLYLFINDLLKDLKKNSTINNVLNSKDKYISSDVECSDIDLHSSLENNDSVFEEGSTPLYYLPSKQLQDKKNLSEIIGLAQEGLITPGDFESRVRSKEFIEKLMSKISIGEKSESGKGFGLIYGKNENDVPFDVSKEKSVKTKYERYDKSVSLMGANDIYLLSHDSKKPNKSPIDLSGTLDGINETRIIDEIQGKTSSLVRGEELLEFLEIVISFVINHVHGMPGEKPNPTSAGGGITVEKILEEKNRFKEKVLNKNIRIN